MKWNKIKKLLILIGIITVMIIPITTSKSVNMGINTTKIISSDRPVVKLGDANLNVTVFQNLTVFNSTWNQSLGDDLYVNVIGDNITGSLDVKKTLHLNNSGGISIDYPTARGSGKPTDYWFHMGGGSAIFATPEGGNFTMYFDDSIWHKNIFTIDVGQPPFADATQANEYRVCSNNGVEKYCFISKFGGFSTALGYGFALETVKGSEARTRDMYFYNNVEWNGNYGKVLLGVNDVDKMTISSTSITTSVPFTPHSIPTANIGATSTSSMQMSHLSLPFAPYLFDILLSVPNTANQGSLWALQPSGYANDSAMSVYSSPILTGGTSFTMRINGNRTGLDVSKGTIDVYDLDIGTTDVNDVLERINIKMNGTILNQFTSAGTNITGGNLNVVNNVTIEDNLDVTGYINQTDGNATINLIYGEMYNYSDSSDPFFMDLPVAGTYYNLSNMTAGTLNGFQFTDNEDGSGSYLTAEIDGLYEISFTVSFKGETAGGLYGFSVNANHNPSSSRHCYSRRDATTSVGNLGVTCLLDLTVGDEVVVMVENENANRGIYVHTANLNLRRVGR